MVCEMKKRMSFGIVTKNMNILMMEHEMLNVAFSRSFVVVVIRLQVIKLQRCMSNAILACNFVTHKIS